MRTIFTNWTIMRCLRLVLGLWALVQAFSQREMTVWLLSGFLLLTALANIGCCGANGCVANYRKSANEKEISYEEVDHKQ